MDCKDIKLMLFDHVSDKTGANESQVIESHLAGCPGCRSEVQSIKTFRAAVGHETEWKPDKVYWSTIVPKVHQRMESRSITEIPSWILRLLSPAAGAAVLIFIFANLIVFNVSENNSDIANIMNQTSNEELMKYIQAKTILGISDGYAATADKSDIDDDSYIVKSLVDDADQLLAYASEDERSVINFVSEDDADAILSVIDKRY